MTSKRPTKDEYFMWLAVIVATRSTCDRLHVGCVIVDSSGHILSTGYNGSAPGTDHCSDKGHLILKGSCVRTIHAEQNAVGHAANVGTSLRGATAYTTNHPCIQCAKLLAAAGITRVVCLDGYRVEYDTMAEQAANLVVHKFIGDRPWKR